MKSYIPLITPQIPHNLFLEIDIKILWSNRRMRMRIIIDKKYLVFVLENTSHLRKVSRINAAD